MELKEKLSIGEIEKTFGIKARARDIVEQYYGIDIGKVTRVREYVEARSMFFKLLRDNTRLTFRDIGESVGKDHASVVHCIKQLEYDMEFDSGLHSKYSKITAIYNESLEEDMEGTQSLVEITISYNRLKESYKLLSKNYQMLMKRHKEIIDEREKRKQRYIKKAGWTKE